MQKYLSKIVSATHINIFQLLSRLLLQKVLFASYNASDHDM